MLEWIERSMKCCGVDTLHEKAWFKSIAAILGVLLTLAGILKAVVPLFGHHEISALVAAPPRPTEIVEARTPPSVTNAPVVAAASSQRTLDDAFKQQLRLQLTDKSANILVVCQRGDAEAKKYGQEVLSFLQAEGYRGAGISFTAFPLSFQGTDIEKDGNRVFVKIGPKPV